MKNIIDMQIDILKNCKLECIKGNQNNKTIIIIKNQLILKNIYKNIKYSNFKIYMIYILNKQTNKKKVQ